MVKWGEFFSLKGGQSSWFAWVVASEFAPGQLVVKPESIPSDFQILRRATTKTDDKSERILFGHHIEVRNNLRHTCSFRLGLVTFK